MAFPLLTTTHAPSLLQQVLLLHTELLKYDFRRICVLTKNSQWRLDHINFNSRFLTRNFALPTTKSCQVKTLLLFQMGKKNFKDLYRRIKREHQTVICEISAFSDKFNPLRKYAGVIIYGIDGKFEWENHGEHEVVYIQQRCIYLYEFFLFFCFYNG